MGCDYCPLFLEQLALAEEQTRQMRDEIEKLGKNAQGKYK